ncbi:putative ABC transporter, permease protein [uncultured spirochete]|uniref:Putative ABC transporter, permease protein n=1 Tax=uncultured spirochete TaxID=156406 RepID=A0A3P3XPF6_9SPIR|nr:putative ABC transporter, permease protein [uncultured spirochete]
MNKVIPRIALRNLSRQKKRNILLGGAIAFSIMIVTLVNGFTGAFIENVSENFAYLMAGHVFIQGSERTASGKKISAIRDDSIIFDAIANSGIKYKTATRSSEASATLVFEGKSTSQNLTGFDLENSGFLRERLVLKQGTWDAVKAPDALIISEKVAKKLNVLPGDRVTARLQTVTGQNNIADFTIAAISVDSSIIGSAMTYVNLSYLNEAIGLKPDEYTSLNLMLDDLKDSAPFADRLYTSMKGMGLQLFDRNQKNESGSTTPFQAMLQSQNKETWEGVKYRVYTIDDVLSQAKQIVNALDTASTVVLIVLFTIIMIGIANTFRMVMYERIKEIGTMRALGVQRGEIRSLFLYEALFLALGGALAGIILALVGMNILQLINFGMDSPAFLIMKNGHLSFSLPPLRAIGNIAIIAVLTLVSAFFPARAAAKMEPAEALRTLK